jgi:CBS domain-containing protein
VYREYGVDPLERTFVDEVMTRDVTSINGDTSIGEVLRTFYGPDQAHRAYPVIASGKLIGVVDRERLNGAASRSPDTAIATLFADLAPPHALPGETCRAVASRMAVYGLERLPVVDSASTLQLVGIVSRSDLLKVTRELHEEEYQRVRFLTWDAPST